MTTQPAQRLREATNLRAAPLHLVLVEPQIPPNTGNVARLCAATGCALHLVEPVGFSIDDRELKRAGLDYWSKLEVVVHPSLETALAHFAGRAWFFSKRAQRRYGEVNYAFGDALFFGKETAGLPPFLLDEFPGRALHIPMRRDSVRSLNLSTAVGITAYAALAQLSFPDLV
ncbi:MAG TPA: tRNA (cytidine(34)-2'-O)-methyltransferase [Candidatus Acidoferrales bacterium]|nr:tRNA (cytidine(34)-2'-O)-methyltransferase [Candidatus Acidoferrales bacterium]